MKQGKRGGFIVNRVACDWVTLTTSERYVYNEFVQMVGESVDWKATSSQKRLQYSGIGGDGFFYGVGIQDGSPHYMMILSGLLAGQLLPVWAGRQSARLCNCTRFDIQITIPKNWKERETSGIGRDILARQREGTSRTGAALSVKMVVSDRANDDTVYLGSRTSDRFIRIYDKVSEGVAYLRYELEVKGRTVARLWDEYLTGASALPVWLRGSIPDYARTVFELHQVIAAIGANDTDRSWIETGTSDWETKKAWLNEQVRPALVRAAIEGNRDEVLEWLDKMYLFI